jgi:hypothetical protein
MKVFLVVKHFPELVFNPKKNVFKYAFKTKKEALSFIQEVKDKDKSNSIDFLEPDTEKNAIKMVWRIEEVWDGYFEYDIIEIEV